MEASQFSQHDSAESPFPLSIDIEGHSLQLLKTVLKIIHDQDVPSTKDERIVLDELYNMVQLSEYFQCGEALRIRAWVELTMPSGSPAASELGPDVPQLEARIRKLLHVASVFRQPELFKAVTTFCIREIALVDDACEKEDCTCDLDCWNEISKTAVPPRILSKLIRPDRYK